MRATYDPAIEYWPADLWPDEVSLTAVFCTATELGRFRDALQAQVREEYEEQA